MSIRLRLALWCGDLFALVLLLVTLLSYAFHVRSHYDDRDRAPRSRDLGQGAGDERVREEWRAAIVARDLTGRSPAQENARKAGQTRAERARASKAAVDG